ncbi:hypothetical protein AC578_3282 [Pseudocercospora eumusae]|uniref:Uncharacterized protein n=1 Tax=Pseudocercospora eumusae TaxID=321146 RepID=A0A139HCH5_9PEZI|nr:hypothetical protein AC578_3282 [Pseudocercospora eumusae]
MRQRSDSRVLPVSVFTHQDGDRRASSSMAAAASDTAAKTGFRAMLNFQGRLFFFFILTWVVFILYIIWPQGTAELPVESIGVEQDAKPANITTPPARFHLLVPASKPNVNLCKVLVSAGISGYPDPVIINWNQTYNEAQYVAGGSHLAKIRGVHDYLQRFQAMRDDDLVLVIDGFDVWLQLRPQTLIDRYFDINRRADERIANELKTATQKYAIRQEIVIGTQKRCWPWSAKDPPCYAAPFSSLPPEIYGPGTDTDVGFEPNPYIKYRPRYLNSGYMMGSVKAMRRMFERAMVLLSGDANFGSDQHIFSHIFGDQSVWREVVRREERSEAEIMHEASPEYQAPYPWNEKHLKQVAKKSADAPGGTLEFSIGLDYEMLLGINTVFSEDDTEWLHWSNETALREAEARVEMPQEHQHMQKLNDDIIDTAAPFETSEREPSLPQGLGWSEVSLFTNVWTGIVPAIIHHNAHRDNRKALRKEWWDRIWFTNYTRKMYDIHVRASSAPVAHSGYDKDNMKDYWPTEKIKGGGGNGPKIDSSEESERSVRFDDICHDFHEEVFRDGQGPWIQPT